MQLNAPVETQHGELDVEPQTQTRIETQLLVEIAWSPRTLGPGSVPITDTEFPTQLGDMKLEANLEFRFPIWGIVHGATFFDVGNIWYVKNDPSEYSTAALIRTDTRTRS